MPTSLKRFELAFLISLAIAVIISAMTPPPPGVDLGLAMAIQAAILLVLLGLVLMVSRRHSRVFRVLLVAFFAIGLVMTAPAAVATLALDAATLLFIVQTAIQVYGLVCLFQPDARAVFRRDQPAPAPTA